MSAPIPIVIEAIQYTAGRDPMIIQFSAKDPNHPLLGKSRSITPTQRHVAGVAENADLATVTWSDEQIEAALVAEVATWGIAVTIVPNVQFERSEAPT